MNHHSLLAPLMSVTWMSDHRMPLEGWAISQRLRFAIALLPITAMTVLEVGVAIGPVLAQIVPDQTLGAEASVVVPNVLINGVDAERIEGGAIRSKVLFHSFDQFNVAEQQGAYFASPVGIERILSRVTGTDVSDIFGTLGVEGTADLFFLNPNGIVFGENARLDIAGSFMATTADAFEFGELGTFSARDPESPSPLLTIAPSAFLFGQQLPGEIVNRSVATVAADGDFPDLTVGLRVPNSETLLLLGGDVIVDGGRLSAFGGRIEIGSVAGAGTVGVDRAGGLTFPDSVERGSVRLENSAVLDGALDGGGDIQIQAGTIDVLASVVQTGIREGFGTVGSQAGDIGMDATDHIQIIGNNDSFSNPVDGVSNHLEADAMGNAGAITIQTPILEIRNTGQILALTSGEGNAGNVQIKASDRILIDADGPALDSRVVTGVFSAVNTSSIGNAGKIAIQTPILDIRNTGRVSSATLGEGNAGSIEISASDRILIDSDGPAIARDRAAGIFSNVAANGVGNAGSITIQTPILEIRNLGLISALSSGRGNAGSIQIDSSNYILIDLDEAALDSVFPSGIFSSVNPNSIGNAGSITIQTPILEIRNTGQISSSTVGEGNAGNVQINASNRILIDADEPAIEREFGTGIYSTVDSNAIGNAGSITIQTSILEIRNDGQIISSTFGEGDAGIVQIEASDRILIDANELAFDNRIGTGISSSVEANAMGNAGTITIQTPILEIRNSGQIGSSTFGEGNAGSVQIEASDRILINVDEVALDSRESTGIFSAVEPNAVGNAGSITIQTPILEIQSKGEIASDTRGGGNAGSVEIIASDRILIDADEAPLDRSFGGGIFSNVNPGAIGDAGTITIQTPILAIRNTGEITSATASEGNAGSVEITASNHIFIDNGKIFSRVDEEAIGNGGNVNITTPILDIQNEGQISAENLNSDNGGDVMIEADFLNLENQSTILTSTESGNGGNIRLRIADILQLQEHSNVSATTQSGRGGNILVADVDTVALTNSTISSSAETTGRAGRLRIDASDRITLSGTSSRSQSGGLLVTSQQRRGGDLTVQTRELIVAEGARISASTHTGRAGSVSINVTNALQLTGTGTELSAQANASGGRAGNINITANHLSIDDGAAILASNQDAQTGGNIVFTGLESLEVNNRGQIAAATDTGEAGRINIVANDIVHLSNRSQLSVETGIESASSPNRDTRRFNLARTEDNAFIPRGGDISITSDRLIVDSNSDILVRSLNGQAGNIDINARLVRLDEGELRATTNDNAPGQTSATITVIGLDLLAMTDDSLISAEALTEADGGNISLNAEDGFVAAPTNANSDLIANAIGGNGGNINIAAAQIFGLGLNSGAVSVLRANQTNDLSVSSQLGIDGVVVIDTLGIDPSKGLDELPVEVADTLPLDAVCAAIAQRESQFIQSGRGGLPTHPTDPFNGRAPSTPWVTRNAHETAVSLSSDTLTQASVPIRPTISEAQSWTTNPNGTITLMATHPQADPQYSDQPATGGCHP